MDTMLQFDGLVYRMWAVGGSMVLLGAFLCFLRILDRKPFRILKDWVELALAAAGWGYILFMAWCIRFPDVAVFEGTLLRENRNSRVAPPLPFTTEYVFDTGAERHPVCYLDVFSQKKIMSQDMQVGEYYCIYYEAVTNVILAVECPES